LEADNLLEEINKYICDSVYFDESKDEMYTLNSGAVISVVQIFKNRYVMKWMGDCRIHIQVNGERIASSSSHDFIEQDLKSLKNSSLVNRRANRRALFAKCTRSAQPRAQSPVRRRLEVARGGDVRP